jgi:hypothetical protein
MATAMWVPLCWLPMDYSTKEAILFIIPEKSLAPVYTIALGDTNVRKDVILARVNHNRFAYLGNNFPLEIVAEAKQFKGSEVMLTVLWDSAKVFEKKIAVTSDNFSETIPVLLEAKKPGLQKYIVRLSSLKGEVTQRNNSTENLY